jgi:hypothetical protein
MFFLLSITSSYAEPLMVSIDKTDLSMDWSAMPESPSYTLFYALADCKGDVDIDTLGSIDMRSTKSLSVSNLPSGLIIYAAIVAHVPGGDVVSNIVKFMGFGGTVSFPVTGAADLYLPARIHPHLGGQDLSQSGDPQPAVQS